MIQRKVAPEMLQPAIKGLLLRKTNQVKLFVLWREIPECGNTPGFARQMLRFLDKITLLSGSI